MNQLLHRIAWILSVLLSVVALEVAADSIATDRPHGSKPIRELNSPYRARGPKILSPEEIKEWWRKMIERGRELKESRRNAEILDACPLPLFEWTRYYVEGIQPGLHQTCGPINMKFKDQYSLPEDFIIRRAMRDHHLFQLRKNRYVYYLGVPPGVKDNKQIALMFQDLETGRAEVALNNPNIIDFDISESERRVAVLDREYKLHMYNLQTLQRETLLVPEPKTQRGEPLRYSLLNWPKSDIGDISIELMGWSDDDRDFWFAAYSREVGIIFYRVRDGLLEAFDYLRNVPIDYTDFNSSRESYSVRKSLFNPNTGRFIHSDYFDDWDDAGVQAVTDLIQQKTARLVTSCSKEVTGWRSDETFACSWQTSEVTASELFCIQKEP